MNMDSRNGRDDGSLEWVEQRLRALSAVEPPRGLKETLLAGVPCRVTGEARLGRIWRWPMATGWAAVAATVVVLCGILWFGAPTRPSASPAPDANSGLGWVLAASHGSVLSPEANALDSNSVGWVPATDYNGVHLPDINALDSNSF
jgi:hypothetical protein